MAEYVIAKPSDKADIIDFLNYVFSQAHTPHDFKVILPKVYADDAPFEAGEHYLAKENGKIRAVVATRFVHAMIAGQKLKFALIGSVSVHPYDRGKGHMKVLMSMAVERAKGLGADIVELAGKRQRYGFFGLENAGTSVKYEITKDNIRHCFPAIDSEGIAFKTVKADEYEIMAQADSLYRKRPAYFIREKGEYWHVMHSWKTELTGIFKNGRLIGYICGNIHELVLENENDLPAVMKAYFEHVGCDGVTVPVSLYERERMKLLNEFAEKFTVAQAAMIRVLSWEKVLTAYFRLKAGYAPLTDGAVAFGIADESFCVTVRDGKPTVETIAVRPENTPVWDPKKAVRLFFGNESFLMPDERFLNWLPLPFFMDSPDMF